MTIEEKKRKLYYRIMKRFWWFLIFFTLMTLSSFAQTREDISVYIRPVIGTPEQAVFFAENFAMETAAAGYKVVEDQHEADYSIKLEVKPNMILYEDGVEEPAPPDEPQLTLQLTLIRNADDVEVISFSYPFNEMEDMYNYNLYLLYEAMANVPLTKLGDIPVPEDEDWWRNKWLYVRMSMDYPVVTTHQLLPDGLYGGNAIYDSLTPGKYAPLDHKVRAVPGATIGLELQYLYWMSAEFDFILRFGDPIGYSFIPELGLALKFPIKPAKHFMLEPFLAGSLSMNTADHYSSFPPMAVGGGFQFGVKGGSMGAFFADAAFLYSLGHVVTKNTDASLPDPHNIHWNRYVFSVGVGYKIGFINRPERKK